MRRLYKTFLVMLCTALLLPASARAQDITTGLIGHWKLDETSGTTAVDSSGNGHNGSMQGGLSGSTDSVPGRANNGLLFNGSTDWIDLGTNPALLPNTFTVSAWIKDVSIDGNDETIFGWAGGDTKPALHIDTGASAPLIYMGNNNFTYFSDVPPLRDGWNHVVFTVPGAAQLDIQSAKLYINKVEATNAGGAESGPQFAKIDAAIGSRAGTGAGFVIDGQMDDVRLYNRVLTPKDIAALYDAWPGHIRYNMDYRAPEYFDEAQWIAMGPPKPSPQGLVGWWKLDDTTLGVAADSSGNGNNGTTFGGLAYSATGQVGLAMNFDGVNDYIDIANESNFDFDSDDPFTITAWINYSNTTLFRTILGKINNGGNFHGYNFQVDAVNQRLRFMLIGATSGCGADCLDLFSPMGSLTRDVWHHVTVTYDGSSASTGVRFYIDGAYAASTILDPAITSSPLNNTAPRIGDTAASAGDEMDGLIDDVRIYNRVLSASEISDLYTYGIGTGTWTQVGNDLSIAGGADTPSITTLNGTTIAYIDNSNDDLRTYSWDGSDWSQVGNDLNISGISDPPSIAALNANTIAYIDGSNDDLRTYRWDGTNWSMVGTELNITGVSWPGIAKLTGDSIAFFDWGNDDLRTYRWDGTNWSQVGNDLNIPGMNIAYPAGMDSNTIALIGGGGLRTYRWDGTNWAQIGNEKALPVGNAHVARLHDDVVALWRHWGIQNVRNLEAWRWDGTNWLQHSSSLYFAGGAGIGDITALDSSTIAFIDDNNVDLRTYRLGHCANPTRREGVIVHNDASNVLQYCDGLDWVAMGPVPGAGGGGCTDPVGNEGNLVYASDRRWMQYCDGSDWIQIGGRGAAAPTAGLVGYWNLDEGSGNTSVNQVPGGTDLSFSGSTAPVWATGLMGGALDFDASDDVATAANYSAINITNALTLSAWINLNSTAGSHSVVAKGIPDLNLQYRIIVRDGELNFNFCVDTSALCNGGASWRAQTTSGANIQASQWYHLAATYDDAANSIVLYVNGAPVPDVPLNGTPENESVLASPGTNVLVGMSWPSSSEDTDGIIDEIRIYDRVLSATEVRNLYYATGGN